MNKNIPKRGTPEFDTFIASSFTNKNVLKIISPRDIIKYDLLTEAMKRNNYTTLNALFSIIKNFKTNKQYDFSQTATNALNILIMYDKKRRLYYETCEEYTTNLVNLGADTELINNYYKNIYDSYQINTNEDFRESNWKYDGNIDIKIYDNYENVESFNSWFYDGLLNSIYKDDIYKFDLTKWCYNVNHLYKLVCSEDIDKLKLKHHNKLMMIYRHFMIDFYKRIAFMWTEFEQFLHSDIHVDEESVDISVNYIVKSVDYMNEFGSGGKIISKHIIEQIQNMLLKPVLEERIYFDSFQTEEKFFISLESKLQSEIFYPELKIVQKYKQKREFMLKEIIMSNYLFMYADVMSIVCKYI